MKDENYITILGWMINQLELSGNELVIYALIYGFSQDGKSKFKGAIKYLSDSLGVSKQSAIELLKKLTKRRLIKKYETGRGRSKKCDYSVDLEIIKKFNGQESLPMIGQESLHHININNIPAGSNEPPDKKSLS